MLKTGGMFWIGAQLIPLLAAVLLAGCNPAPNSSVPAAANSAPLSSVTGEPRATNAVDAEVETDVDKSTEHLLLGNRLLAQERFREAVAEFELAARYNPEDEDVYYNLALAQARAGDKESAKRNYGKALEIFPDYVEAHNNLGNILVGEGNYAEAITHFQKALQQDEKNASTHNNLGTAYARQKKIANSLVHFETAVQLQPDYPDAQFNLGNAYLLLQRHDDAIATFTKLLEFHPEFSRARSQLEKAKGLKAAGAK